MRSSTVKENHIGSAVSEILVTHTHRHAVEIFLLLYKENKELFYTYYKLHSCAPVVCNVKEWGDITIVSNCIAHQTTARRCAQKSAKFLRMKK